MSSGATESSSDPDPVTGLTSKEKHLVTSSWGIIRKDARKSGVDLFMIFFKNYPKYQQLFPFRDVPYENLRDNKKLKTHGTVVLHAISSVVDNLDDDEVLVYLLVRNGENHAFRGVTEQAYWDLKDTLLELLQQKLASNASPEVLAAWDKTIKVAFTVAVNALKTKRKCE